MKLQRTARYNPEQFLLIPLITVLFQVLAFATLSREFMRQPGLNISLPASSFVLNPQRRPLIVSITATDLPTLYFQDRQVDIGTLETLLAQPGLQERNLIIRADRHAPWDLVFQVMNLGASQGYHVSVAATESMK